MKFNYCWRSTYNFALFICLQTPYKRGTLEQKKLHKESLSVARRLLFVNRESSKTQLVLSPEHSWLCPLQLATSSLTTIMSRSWGVPPSAKVNRVIWRMGRTSWKMTPPQFRHSLRTFFMTWQGQLFTFWILALKDNFGMGNIQSCSLWKASTDYYHCRSSVKLILSPLFFL